MLDFNKALTDKIFAAMQREQDAMRGIRALVEACFAGETRVVVPSRFVASGLLVERIHVEKGMVRFTAKDHKRPSNDQKYTLVWFGTEFLAADEVMQLLDMLRKKRYTFI